MLSTILKHLLYFITVSNMQIFGFKKKKSSLRASAVCVLRSIALWSFANSTVSYS